MPNEPTTSLWTASPESYSGDFRSDLLEQYKLYVGLMDQVSQRRQAANSFFLAVNTALVSAIGITWPEDAGLLQTAWVVVVALAGGVLCWVWRALVTSYRGLNTGKFLVIHELEERLPARLFKYEWQELGEGKDPKLYRPFSHVEAWVPVVFGALYGLLGLAWLVQVWR